MKGATPHSDRLAPSVGPSNAVAPARLRRLRLSGVAFIGLLAAAAGSSGSAFAATPTPSPQPPLPSAIGNQSVFWLAVSPLYKDTGLVLATTSGNSQHLWVSHNGGSTWGQAAAKGWNGGRPVVAADGSGHELIYSDSGQELDRSTDDGETWSRAGGSGTPTPAPGYASNHTVAVAGTSDYLLRDTSSSPVTGSGGAVRDISFAYAPGFPSSGRFTPALLSAGDKQHGLPVIQQCDAHLTCQGSATLAGATTFSLPVSLAMSSTYADDGVVFAQSGKGLYKSTNGGNSFSPLAIPATATTANTATPMMAVAPGYSENGPTKTLFVAVFEIFPDPKNPRTGGGIYKSADGGTTWSVVGSPSPMDNGAMTVALAPDGRLFASYLSTHGSGLLCSVDGTSWQASCPSVGSYHGPQPAGETHAKATACAATPCQPNSAAGGAQATPAPVGNGDGASGKGAGGNAGNALTGASGQQGQNNATSKARPFLLVAIGVAGLLAVLLGARAIAGRLRRQT